MDYSKLICKYDDSQLEEHYQQFLTMVGEEVSGERGERLVEMYSTDLYHSKLLHAPASSIGYFHNAFIGGYVLHINNVVNASKGVMKLYEHIGGMIDFTEEELIFAAIHHDLGKLGDETGDFYLINDSDWHIKNQQAFFKTNGDLQYMDTADRTMLMLNNEGIKMNWKEMLGIRLADGMYDDNTHSYLKGFSKDKKLKTNLPYILHTADFLASKKEFDDYKKEVGEI